MKEAFSNAFAGSALAKGLGTASTVSILAWSGYCRQRQYPKSPLRISHPFLRPSKSSASALHLNLKCTLNSQLAVEVEELFTGVISDMGVTINYEPEGADPIEEIFDYVESMRCSLWDIAFFREFKGPDQVHKNKTSDQMPNFREAVKRVLFRYFKYILYPRKAVSKVPAFFTNYLDITSFECMYTPAILKAWDSVHYERCGWYMDCPPKKPPAFDVPLRDSLQPALSKLPAPTPPETTAPSPTQRKSRKKGKGKGRVQKQKAAEIEEEDIDDEDLPATAAVIVEKGAEQTGDQLLDHMDVVTSGKDHSASMETRPPSAKRSHVLPAEAAPAENFRSPTMKAMSRSLPASSSKVASKVLVINDTFPAMASHKAKTKKFPASYESMTSVLTEVGTSTLNYFSFTVIIYHNVLVFTKKNFVTPGWRW